MATLELNVYDKDGKLKKRQRYKFEKRTNKQVLEKEEEF